jgi:uncharacterized delta-60 repeat protein
MGVHDMQRLIASLVISMGACVSTAQAEQNVDGFPDPSFGTGLIDPRSSPSDAGKVVRVVPGSKFLIAGTCGIGSLSYFCAIRFHPYSIDDASFGPDGTGVVTFDHFFGQGFPIGETLHDMLSLSDGRIAFLGIHTLAILISDGSALDTGAGGGTGFVYPANFQSSALAEQADHKILVAGYATRNDGSGNVDMAVQRFMPDLSVDTNFGTNGSQSIIFNLGSSSSFANSIAVQTNGSIVLAGSVKFTGQSGSSIGIARISQSGQPDPAFGSGGSIYQGTYAENSALAVRVDQQGRIVFAGYTAGDTTFGTRSCLINRLLVNGNQDYNFNANQPQIFTVPVGANNAACEMVDLALQADGTVLAVGSLLDKYFTAVRLTPSGTFDSTFGVGGKSYGNFDASALTTTVRNGAMAISSGLMIAGASTNSDTKFGIAKLTLDKIFASGFEN